LQLNKNTRFTWCNMKFNTIPLMTNDKYYNDFTSEARAVMQKFGKSNPLTPLVCDLIETDDFFIEISCNYPLEGSPDCFGVTTIIKSNGIKVGRLTFGGNTTRLSAIEEIKVLLNIPI
jgi:hypothetical protein